MVTLTADPPITRTLVTGGDAEAAIDFVPAAEDFKREIEGQRDDDDASTEPLTEIIDYLPAPEVERLGLAMIRQYEEFKPLAPVKVAFFWKRRGGTQMGKPKLGHLVKPTGLLKELAEADYIVWLAADHFRETQERMWFLEAATHHQLCHAHVTTKFDKVKREAVTICGTRGHQYEGFRAEAERYRDWNKGLEMARAGFEAFDAAQRQLRLFPNGAR